MEVIDNYLNGDILVYLLVYKDEGEKDKDLIEGEGYYIEKREVFLERELEYEFVEEEEELKVEGSENFD